MAPNSLSPASVVIDYHSAYAPHKMTIPTLEWFPTSVTGDLGSYAAHDSSTIDAEDMIMALIDVMKVFLKANAAFDNITVYTQAAPDAPNIPRKTKAISVAGTNISTSFEAAVSWTWNFKTALNGNMKLILLDIPFPSTWLNKVYAANFSTEADNVVAEVTSSQNAWTGRDDAQVTSCRNITIDINDKLQRAYFR